MASQLRFLSGDRNQADEFLSVIFGEAFNSPGDREVGNDTIFWSHGQLVPNLPSNHTRLLAVKNVSIRHEILPRSDRAS
jgi:hypothetical protein